MEVFLLTTGFVFGLSFGMYIAIIIIREFQQSALKASSKIRDHKKMSRKKSIKKEEKIGTKRISERGIFKKKTKEKNYAQKTLKEKLNAKDGASWTEFNCNEDETNQSSHIKQIQRKEDRSYQYIKHQSKKNNKK